MKPIVLESPYAGDVAMNLRYLRACMRDCLLRRESPYASHHQYTAPGVLRDEVPDERELGLAACSVWRTFAELVVFYEDLGWSRGMTRGLGQCVAEGLLYERRKLGPGWLEAQLAREAAGDSLEDWLRSLVR
jgi:hypothetical protein